ncbi:MAG: hypothetical protein AAB368_08680, partial [bacterium]
MLVTWLLAAAVASSSTTVVRWEPLGLSGGGSMYTPAISPVDPKFMMVNCDMSDAFLSEDGGANWRMIHHSQLRGNTACRPAFHPVDRNVIFAATGWSGGLAVSYDAGASWAPLGNIEGDLCGEIVIDPGRPSRMLAGTAAASWLSEDGGKHWTRCGAPEPGRRAGPRGRAVGFHFDQTSPAGKRTCFAAT